MCRNYKNIMLETSPSNRAVCPQCKKNIKKDTIRARLSFWEFGSLKYWFYHPECCIKPVEESITDLKENRLQLKQAVKENALAEDKIQRERECTVEVN